MDHKGQVYRLHSPSRHVPRLGGYTPFCIIPPHPSWPQVVYGTTVVLTAPISELPCLVPTHVTRVCLARFLLAGSSGSPPSYRCRSICAPKATSFRYASVAKQLANKLIRHQLEAYKCVPSCVLLIAGGSGCNACAILGLCAPLMCPVPRT